jgi:hypothetical protein
LFRGNDRKAADQFWYDVRSDDPVPSKAED